MTHDVLPWPFEPDRTVIDGRFRVKGIVGQGGMGRVYRVEDMNLFDRICVLKMLAPKLHPSQVPQHDASALLINEVKLLSLLSEISDSFVTIFGRGTAYVAVPLHAREGESRKHVELDLPYYVMELLQGSNFETLIERHKKEQAFLSWSIVLGLCSQAARALSIAHAKGIVHRDIKPNNLFLHEFGGRKPIVKFIDFGVSTQHGAPGVFGSGTKRYGSPELLRNGAPLIEDKQSDIYPLGLVMYELAALVHALVEHKADYAYAHLNETPTPLSARRADTPPGFEKIVHRALAKRPADRPTADEIAKELDAIRDARGEDEDVAPHLSELLSSMRDRAAERKKPRTTASHQTVTAPPSTTEEPRSPGQSPRSAQSEVFLQHSAPPSKREATTKPADGRVVSALAASVASPIVIVEANKTREMTNVPFRRPQPEAPSSASPRSDVVRAALVNDTVPDGEPLFFTEKTDPVPGLVPDIVDEEVPIFTSMARVFEEAQETAYQSSPFDQDGEPARALPPTPVVPAPPPAVTAPVMTLGPATTAPSPKDAAPLQREGLPQTASAFAHSSTTAEGPLTRERREHARRRSIIRVVWGIAAAFVVVTGGFAVGRRFVVPAWSSGSAPPAAAAPVAPAPVPVATVAPPAADPVIVQPATVQTTTTPSATPASTPPAAVVPPAPRPATTRPSARATRSTDVARPAPTDMARPAPTDMVRDLGTSVDSGAPAVPLPAASSATVAPAPSAAPRLTDDGFKTTLSH